MFCKFLAITVLGLLFQFIGIGLGQDSPCPSVFRYGRDPKLVDGWIQLRNVPQHTVVRLTVVLSVAAGLSTPNYGTLELTSKDQAVENINRRRPLIYRIQFPIQQPRPIVTRITLNEQERCTGSRAIGLTTTTITLQHTLRPPGVSEQNPVVHWNSYMSDPTVRPVSNTDVVSENSLKPTQQDRTNFNTCGKPRSEVVNPLISKGDITQRGDWPWLVALFVTQLKIEFQCAGNLISNKHVLTAAHCLKSSDGQDLPANVFIAALGRYELKGWSKKDNGMNFEVLHHQVHAEYGQRGGFGNDLAVLTLAETVTFGQFIMPICVSSEPSEIVGKTGIVVGWGRNEHGNPVTPKPRMIRVPIVSQLTCLQSNRDFVPITSDRTFCGGARDGSGPCNGDSGAGLMIYDSQRKQYYLRGLVSLSLLDRSTQACDLSEYVVYTDIAKYASWIQQIITS